MESPESKRFHYETPCEYDWEINERFGIHIHKKAQIGVRCKFGRNIVINEGVALGDEVEIGNNVKIHPNVNIDRGSKILDGTCIYPDTRIGRNAKILECVNLGRPPEIAGSITRQLKTEYPPLSIGASSLIGPNVRLYRGVEIGDNVSIYEFVTVREECRLGNGVVLAPGVTVNYGTVIGNNVRVMHSSHLTGGMVIEDDVFISLHVGSTNDRMIEGVDNDNEEKRWRGAIIRKGAMIGAGVMLAPGVEIGEGAHIAMLSIVTRNIPPHTFAAGSPARVVPHR